MTRWTVLALVLIWSAVGSWIAYWRSRDREDPVSTQWLRDRSYDRTGY